MKFFTVLVCTVVMAVTLDAQSLEVIALQKDFNIPADSTWKDFRLGVTNVTSKTVPVRVRVDKSQCMTGHRVKFCFAQECYDETTIESSRGGGTSTLSGGMSDNDTFFGDFRSDGANGTSNVPFTFFNDNDASDKVVVVLHLTSGVSDVEEATDMNSLSSIPNPATDVVTFRLNNAPQESRVLSIVDVQGNEVGSTVFATDRISIGTSQLANGTYAALVRNTDGSVKSVRFVVQH